MAHLSTLDMHALQTGPHATVCLLPAIDCALHSKADGKCVSHAYAHNLLLVCSTVDEATADRP